MSGVTNLRVLASAFDNVNKIEDPTKDFLSDFDEDNAVSSSKKSCKLYDVSITMDC